MKNYFLFVFFLNNCVGTPIQNNLNEFYNIIEFLKPYLLGSLDEFKNRYRNPINNGNYKDSEYFDVFLMKKQSHNLHHDCKGFIHRKDEDFIREMLPPKHEYAIKVRLSETQIEIYKKYLEIANSIKLKLFRDFQFCKALTTHPWLIREQISYKKNTENEAEIVVAWNKYVLAEYELNIEMSGKFMLFLRILEDTLRKGEKL